MVALENHSQIHSENQKLKSGTEGNISSLEDFQSPITKELSLRDLSEILWKTELVRLPTFDLILSLYRVKAFFSGDICW